MHQCKVCNKTFRYESHLKQHVKTHSVEKPVQPQQPRCEPGSGKVSHQCDICNVHFRSSDQLEFHHFNVHQTKDLYQCEFCDRRFSQNVKMNEHLVVHTGIEPAQVNGKKQIYSFKVSLKRYKNLYRKMEVKGVTSLYKFAKILLNAFGFHLDHCFEFRNNNRSILYKSDAVYSLFCDSGFGNSENPNHRSVKSNYIHNIFKPNKKMEFMIDYNDSWEFLVECLGYAKPEAGKEYPIITEVKGIAPPQYGYSDSDDAVEGNDDFYCSEEGKSDCDDESDHDEKPHRCNVCGLLFAQVEQLETHLLTHPAEKSTQNQNLPCNEESARQLCNKSYQSQSALQEHQLIPTEEKPIKMNKPDQSASQQNMDIPIEEKPIKMENPDQLQQHMDIPMEEKLVPESKVSQSLSTLQENQLFPVEEKLCQIKKQCQSPSTLQEQQSIPKEEKPALKELIYTFKVKLKIPKKPCHRTIEVKGTSSLSEFAEAIVNSVGFRLDHAFEFHNTGRRYENDVAYTLFFDDKAIEHEPNDRSVMYTYVNEVFSPKKKMEFLFDYGDEWKFLIECLSVSEPIAGRVYPIVTKEKGQAPPQYPDIDDESD